MSPNRPSRLPWLILPAGCLTILLISCGGFFAVVYLGVSQLITSSEPYQHALLAAKTSPAVIEQIGKPIEVSGPANGSLNASNANGTADLEFSITGPKGRGRLHVVASRAGGQWSYATIQFTPDDPDAKPIELATGPDSRQAAEN